MQLAGPAAGAGDSPPSVWYPSDVTEVAGDPSGEAAGNGDPSGEKLGCQWEDCQEHFPTLDSLVNHVNDQHVRVERDVEYKCRWHNCPRNGKGFNARYVNEMNSFEIQ